MARASKIADAATRREFVDGPVIALRSRGDCLCSKTSRSRTRQRVADGAGSGIGSRGSSNPIGRRVCGYAYDGRTLVGPWLTRNAPLRMLGADGLANNEHRSLVSCSTVAVAVRVIRSPGGPHERDDVL